LYGDDSAFSIAEFREKAKIAGSRLKNVRPENHGEPLPRLRHAARILILDPAGRLLLFRFDYASGPLAGTGYWGVPGGGVEKGETFPAAAIRELREETGIAVSDPGCEIAENSYPFRLSTGERVEARDHYFLLRLNQVPDVIRDGLTEEEREHLRCFRWWTPVEILTGAREIVPPGLPAVLRRAGVMA
jgi:8-oxo-dGTP pyrophosphatase MutT (NUDIX family)